MPQVMLEPSMLELFQTESIEHLERMQEILMQSESISATPTEIINELFRMAHNIKGSSGMLELSELQALMHSMENGFSEVREGKRSFDSEQIESLLHAVENVKEYISMIPDDVSLEEAKSEVAGLFEKSSNTAAATKSTELKLTTEEEQTITKWQEENKEAYGIEVRYQSDCSYPAAAAIVMLKYFEKYGHIFKTAPEQSQMLEGPFSLLKAVLMTEKELQQSELDEILQYSGHGEESVSIRKWTLRKNEDLEHAKKIHAKSDDIIRLDYSKVENLMSGLDTLSNLKFELLSFFDTEEQRMDRRFNELRNLLFHLDQGIRDLQGDVVELGMLPVKQLFSRFPMIVREVAKKCGKEIELVFEGEESELDKRLADHLGDPLTHLVRNAVDHGVETPEERQRLGKREQGRVVMSAVQQGESIIIRVSDDGRGLDFEKIKNKAVSKGIITPEAAAEMDDTEAANLIFAPGFSTTEQVTDISGRGVGMDVVRSSILDLNGTIRTISKLGEGTTFEMCVPLTRAVVAASFVRSGGKLFGFSLDDVKESISVKADDIIDRGRNRFIVSQGVEIPLYDISRRLMGEECRPGKERLCIIAANSKGKVAIMVEEFFGEEKVLVKSFNRRFIDDPVISGLATLSEGETGIVINTDALIGELHGEDGRKLKEELA